MKCFLREVDSVFAKLPVTVPLMNHHEAEAFMLADTSDAVDPSLLVSTIS